MRKLRTGVCVKCKLYITLVFKLSVCCAAEGYVSGFQAASLLLCFEAYRGWVTEGQLKKRIRFVMALFMD